MSEEQKMADECANWMVEMAEKPYREYDSLNRQVVELKKLANCLLDVDECYCCGREFPYGETAHNPDCLAKAILEVKL